MQVTETHADGLRRDYKVVIPAQDIESKVDERLKEIGRTAKLPGFRPGKVPLTILRKRFGQSVMGEVLEKTVQDSSGEVIREHALRPAMQPKIEITQFEEQGDLEFSMSMEVLPDIDPPDPATLELERLTADPQDEQVQETLDRIADQNKESRQIEEDRAAANGDIVEIDFAGSVDGTERDDMKAEDFRLELGSNSFIGDFEEQLVGAKAGEEKTIKVTFPDEYGNKDLAGRKAEFKVTVKALHEPVKPEINDELAKKFGQDSLDALKDTVKEQLSQQFSQFSRQRLKRQVLDKLADQYDFTVPEGMVESEFNSIWQQVEHEREHGHVPDEDKDKSEDDLKAEYRSIAERRVRLGLVLSDLGQRNNIQVTQEELRRAMIQEAQRYPGQEQQVLEYFQKNPRAIEALRAPIYEDKVIDYIIEMAQVTDRKVDPEELTRDPDAADLDDSGKDEDGKSESKAASKGGSKSSSKSKSKARSTEASEKAEDDGKTSAES